MSGHKVSKADLVELARVLGDELAGSDELAGESMVTIYHRCLLRGRELAEPPAIRFHSSRVHPAVKEWCRQAMVYVDAVRERLGQDPPKTRDPEAWVWFSMFNAVREASGVPCAHELDANGFCLRCCQHVDKQPPALAQQREREAEERRTNAEQWAQSQGVRR